MAAAIYTFDAERSVESKSCEECGADYTLVKGFVLKDGEPHAVAFAALHDHDGAREAWLDVILGTFGQDDFSDHVTFGCRVGPVPAEDEPAASLVAAAAPYGASPLFGRKLARDEAIGHPWLPAFWDVVDFLLLQDSDVHQHVYG